MHKKISVLDIPIQGQKDILSWTYEKRKGVLTLKVRKSVADTINKMSHIEDTTNPSTCKIVNDAVYRLNYEAKMKYLHDAAEYEKAMIEWKGLSREERKIAQKPVKPIQPKKFKSDQPDIYFKTFGTRRAFFKAYFLYEFLINELGNIEGFYQKDFIVSLQYGSESVASSNIESIRLRLMYEGILYTDTSEHFKSVRQGNTTKKMYKYVFHPLPSSDHQETGRPTEIKYKVSGSVKTLTEKATSLRGNKEEVLREEQIIHLLSNVATDNSSIPECTLLEINELGCVLENGEFLKNETNKLIVKYIENNSGSSKNTTLYSPHTKDFCGHKPLELAIYIPPYERLSLDGLTNYDLIRKGSFGKLKSYLLKHREKTKVTNSTRLSHAFHTLPRKYRKHLTLDGSPLEEIMDVSNCYYTLMYKAMQLSDDINPDELSRYEDLVRRGKFYEDVARYVKLNSLPICDIDDYNINWSEEEYLAFRGLNKRDLVKLWLQSYRNFIAGGQAEHNHHNIDMYYRKEFPTIREWLFSYARGKNLEGKTVKQLQNDMCKIETYIISRVALKVASLGVTPFTLHDGIYLSEDHINVLQTKLNLTSSEEVTQYVNNLFWFEFDSLNPEQVRQLLGGDYQITEKPFTEISAVVENKESNTEIGETDGELDTPSKPRELTWDEIKRIRHILFNEPLD
jgi:hypothetical protein